MLLFHTSGLNSVVPRGAYADEMHKLTGVNVLWYMRN